MVLLVFTLVGAAIGYLLVSIFQYFLLKPYSKHSFLRVQGWLPARKEKIAAYLAKIAQNKARQLIANQDIKLNINNVLPEIEQHIDQFLKEKLKEKMPAIAMFIGAKTQQTIKAGLMEEIESLLPKLVDKYLADVVEKNKVEQFAINTIQKITPRQIDDFLKTQTGSHWRLMPIYGLLLGAIIGISLSATHLLIS